MRIILQVWRTNRELRDGVGEDSVIYKYAPHVKISCEMATCIYHLFSLWIRGKLTSISCKLFLMYFFMCIVQTLYIHIIYKYEKRYINERKMSPKRNLYDSQFNGTFLFHFCVVGCRLFFQVRYMYIYIYILYMYYNEHFSNKFHDLCT